MIVMELMGLGDLSKYLWENYRYEAIKLCHGHTHAHTHTHRHTHTHAHTHTCTHTHTQSNSLGSRLCGSALICMHGSRFILLWRSRLCMDCLAQVWNYFSYEVKKNFLCTSYNRIYLYFSHNYAWYVHNFMLHKDQSFTFTYFSLMW